MALYYLQFSAVNSQVKNHSGAFRTAKKALKTLKMVCEKSIKVDMISSKNSYDSLYGGMLAELAAVPEEVELNKASSYYIEAKKYLSKLKQKGKSTTDTTVDHFTNFTIGEVMQISPITLPEIEERLSMKEDPSLINKLYKSIYISICFFTLATESRLLATESRLLATESRLLADSKYDSEEVKRNSIELKKSELFHLRAIYIAAKYIPADNKYLSHIVKSFHNHYDLDLQENMSSQLIEVSCIEV